MIKTASLENSKRLYELAPEWDDTHFKWVNTPVLDKRSMQDDYRLWKVVDRGYKGKTAVVYYPAPDLDWLLDKLPPKYNHGGQQGYLAIDRSGLNLEYWSAGYMYFGEHLEDIEQVADTPADAACLLLIKLIEQGIVKV